MIYFPLDINNSTESKKVEKMKFCEAEFADSEDLKNIDVLKTKAQNNSDHLIEHVIFNYVKGVVDAFMLLHTDYEISGSKSTWIPNDFAVRHEFLGICSELFFVL